MLPAALTALHLTLSLSAEALTITSWRVTSRDGGKEREGRMSVRLANAQEAWTRTGREAELKQWTTTEWQSSRKLSSWGERERGKVMRVL